MNITFYVNTFHLQGTYIDKEVKKGRSENSILLGYQILSIYS